MFAAAPMAALPMPTRVALRRNKGVQPQCQLGKDRAEAIDVHVVGRIGDGVGAGAEQQQNRPPKGQHDAGQEDGEQKQHPGAASYDLFRLFGFTLPEEDRRLRRAAHADQRGKSGDRQNHRRGTPTPASACLPTSGMRPMNILSTRL